MSSILGKDVSVKICEIADCNPDINEGSFNLDGPKQSPRNSVEWPTIAHIKATKKTGKKVELFTAVDCTMGNSDTIGVGFYQSKYMTHMCNQPINSYNVQEGVIATFYELIEFSGRSFQVQGSANLCRSLPPGWTDIQSFQVLDDPLY